MSKFSKYNLILEGGNGKEGAINIENKIVDDYYEGTLLGKGAFGSAMLCNRLSENNAKYVIKIIDFSKIPEKSKPANYNLITNEIFILDILRTSCDEYIMCYIKTLFQGPFVYIVCEYLENYNTLDKIFQTEYSVETIAKLCNNLTLGLEKIHSLNICHRDIKPQNIMYNFDTNKIKYIDFGFSVLAIDGTIKPNIALAGTPNYIYPPMRHSSVFTFDMLKQADKFALGMVIFLLLSKGKTIFTYINERPAKEITELYRFNENLYQQVSSPRLNDIFVLENELEKYDTEHGLTYVSFTTLMGLQKPKFQPAKLPSETTGGKKIKKYTRKRK